MTPTTPSSHDDFPVFPGTPLGSVHRFQTLLSEGGFGYTVRCKNIKTKEVVAVKLCKNHPRAFRQAQEELAILRSLQVLDPAECGIVRWFGSFLHEDRICLEFELLDQSLFDHMEERRRKPLSMKELRPVLKQLTSAVTHLETVGVVHADIKPENVMIVDRRRHPLSVKLIDFGSSFYTAEGAPVSIVQTLWYRAPEVTLGLPVSADIDVWSLGLLAAELALGSPLYPAEHEYDLVKFIVETQGRPAEHLLNGGSKSATFFLKQCQSWRLKSPEEFAAETGYRSRDFRRFTLSSLDDVELLHVKMLSPDAEERDDLRLLTELLKRMLQLDPDQRIKATGVLQHPFLEARPPPAQPAQPARALAQPRSSPRCVAGDGVPSKVATPPREPEEAGEAQEPVIRRQVQASIRVQLEAVEPGAADARIEVDRSDSVEEGSLKQICRSIMSTLFCFLKSDV